MNDVVLDTSVVARWYEPESGPGTRPALAIRGEYEAGKLHVVAPKFFLLELLNAAARRWRLQGDVLKEMSATFQELRFELVEPRFSSVTEWAGRGLTAYDSTYVAVAEERSLKLITNDREILATAQGIAQPLIS